MSYFQEKTNYQADATQLRNIASPTTGVVDYYKRFSDSIGAADPVLFPGAKVEFNSQVSRLGLHFDTAADVTALEAMTGKTFGLQVTYSKLIADGVTTQTSGSLKIGQTYEITTPGSGDFTNVGAPDNDAGTEFVATGTTPTAWTGATLTVVAKIAQQTVVSNIATVDADNKVTDGRYGPQVPLPVHDWDQAAVELFMPAAVTIAEATIAVLS